MQLDSEVLRIESGVVVIVLKGRLTLGTRLSLLEAGINTMAAGGDAKLILDLEKVEYADSAALGVLLHTTAMMHKKGGQLLLAAPNERLRNLFRLTNTDQLLAAYPDRATCISYLA